MDAKTPQRLLEVGDMAKAARVSSDAVRASLRTLNIAPDYVTSRSSLFSPSTVEQWRAARRQRGLPA